MVRQNEWSARGGPFRVANALARLEVAEGRGTRSTAAAAVCVARAHDAGSSVSRFRLSREH
jgi:hypothetical protein